MTLLPSPLREGRSRVGVAARVSAGAMEPRRLLQHSQNLDRRGRGVVADAIRQAAVANGVVGEDDADAAVRAGSLAQPHPVGGEFGGAGNAVCVGRVGGERALRAGVPDAFGLVADQDAADAAIELGHDHLHGQILWRQALAVGCPERFRPPALNELDYRRTAPGERVLLRRQAIYTEGEAGEVEDDRRRTRGEGFLHKGDGFGLLQRGDEDGERCEVFYLKRRDESFDNCRAGTFEQGAVEEDGDR